MNINPTDQILYRFFGIMQDFWKMSSFFFVKILWYYELLSMVKHAASQDSTDTMILKFVAQPRHITVAEHSNVTIPCVAISLTPITYRWTHIGTTLISGSNTGRYRLTEPDGNLTVINITLKDAGEYRCIASNGFGSALSLKAVIRIAYLYARNPIDSTITSTVYKSVKFPMNAVNSFPKAQFAWKVRRLQSSVYEKIVDGENGRLLISQSGDLYVVGARHEDSGAYRCVVTNSIVKKQIAFNFVLKVFEGAVDRQLSFLLPPVTTEATEGTAQAVLECIVGPAVESGSLQIPTITWHKHDTELDLTHDPKYSCPNGGRSRHKLIINDVQINDSDWYTCIATTKSAVITSPQVQIIVHHKPVLPSLQTGFPSVIQPFEGSVVTIDSRASAGDVTWYKNAVSVLSASNPSLSILANGSLLLQNVSHVDDGLYQVFARTSVEEISSPPVTLHVVERPPIKPTTLASETAVSTRSSTTLESSSIPTTSALTSQTTTENHATQQPSASRFLYTTSAPTSQSTTESHVTPQPSASGFLYQKQTTAGSIVHPGAENQGRMMLLCGTIAGGGVFLLLILIAVFCYKRQTRRRLRQGSIKLKSDHDDSEEFEMKPIEPRTTSPTRSIPARRLRSSESTQDLLQSSKPHEHRVSLDSNDNQFIEDHASAHVNPALTSELAIVSPPVQQTTAVLQEHPCPSSELEQIGTHNKQESDDLNDSGIEEEASVFFPEEIKSIPIYATVQKSKDGTISCQDDNIERGEVKSIPIYATVQKSKDGTISCQDDNIERGEVKSIPIYATVKKSKDGAISCQDDNIVVDRSNDEVLAKGQAAEPFYHVLEGPGDEPNDSEQLETWDEQIKGARFYQSLMQCKQGGTEEENVTRNPDSAHDFPLESEGLVSLKNSLYQSLTPPKNDNVLNEDSNLTTDDLNQGMDDKKESTLPSERMYQPLLLNNENESHLPFHSDRPRSVTGVYQPLTRNRVPFVRCWSDPQRSNPPVSTRPTNGQADLGPIYQTVDDDERCPLNLDDPGSSFPHAPRRTPRASPSAQRITTHEPLHMPIQVRPSRSNRRARNSEHEPRYSPSPGRKNPSTLHPPARSHGRNYSDSSRAFPLMAERTSPSVERQAPSDLSRHVGHRRNRSDIGLCPIDRSEENMSGRPTSLSDSGLPRTPSLGSLDTGEHSRSASDTTHCRVNIGP